MKQTGLKFRAEDLVRTHRAEGMGHRATPAYRAPWYRAVNWDVALSWFCIVATSLCLWYLGIFLFAPFGIKILFGE